MKFESHNYQRYPCPSIVQCKLFNRSMCVIISLLKYVVCDWNIFIEPL